MDDPLFSRLNNAHYGVKKDEAPATTITKDEIQEIRGYFSQLLARNGTRAVNISSIKVVGGSHMRQGFLDTHFQPLLTPGHNLRSAIEAIDTIQIDLQNLGIFDKVGMFLDEAPNYFRFGRNFSTLDLAPTLNLQESKRFLAKTGTDLGNGEGNGYMNGTWKNVFGGGEILSLDATIGTRTKSSYMANFTCPAHIFGKWYKSETIAFITSRNIAWASHEQHVRGISSKLKSATQEIGGEWVWRSVHCQNTASDSIRELAGHSMKSSVYHSWIPKDSRDDDFMPSKGVYFKVLQELGYSAAFPLYKNTIESLFAYSLAPRVTIAASLRAGALLSKKTHVMDRFYLGGPNDVRGFYLKSMGPRDAFDSLGGNFFYAFGIGALLPLPKVPDTLPLRFQTFINGGFLSPDLRLIGLPSVAAGVGLVYRAPMARFELNFSLPLVVRENESPRKGIQFGVGFSFL